MRTHGGYLLLAGLCLVAFSGTGCALSHGASGVSTSTREVLGDLAVPAAPPLLALASDDAAAPSAATPDVSIAPPAGALVPVTILSTDPGKKLELNLPSGEKCPLPCSTQLPTGNQLLVISGDESHAQWIEIPSAGGTLEANLVSPSGAERAGTIMLAAGSIVALVGFVMMPFTTAMTGLIIGGTGLALLIPGWIMSPSGPGSTLTWVQGAPGPAAASDAALPPASPAAPTPSSVGVGVARAAPERDERR